MRLLNVCETAKGGVGTYLNNLAGLSTPGMELHFVVPAQHTVTLDSRLNLITYDYPKRGPRALRNMLTAFETARRALDPEVCFFHSTLSLAALAAMRLRRDRRPAFYCAHGWAVGQYDETAPAGLATRLVEGRLCGLADRVVNVSAGERDMALRLGYRGRHDVIENAVPGPIPDARADLFGDEPDAVHILFVGRMDPQKGLDLLLDAFAAARAKRSDLRLHVVGEAVRKNGAPVAMPPGARMVGWVDKARIDDWYRSADALIVPSRWEGLPLVIPEALRNGTPVLCSDRSGMGTLIDPGRTGQVFALDVPAITGCLTGLDRSALRTMRRHCRTAYEDRFSIQRLLGEMRVLLDDVTAVPG